MEGWTFDFVDASVIDVVFDVAIIVSTNVFSSFSGSMVVTMLFSSIPSIMFVNVDVSSRDAAVLIGDRTLVVSTIVAAVSPTALRCETVIRRGIALSSVTLLVDVSLMGGVTALSDVTRLFLVMTAGDLSAASFRSFNDFLVSKILYLPLTVDFSFGVLAIVEFLCVARAPMSLLVAFVVSSTFLLSLSVETSFAFDLPE